MCTVALSFSHSSPHHKASSRTNDQQGFVATYCLLVCSSPITGRSESALVVRASGEVAEFFDQHELVKRLSATVFTGTLALLGVFAGGACAAAWMAAGLNVPADIGCVSQQFGMNSTRQAG